MRLVNVRGGVTCAVPDDWDEIPVETPDVLYVSRQVDLPLTGFRANMVLTISTLEDLSLAAWQGQNEMAMARTLTGFQLLDRAETNLAGRPAIYRLGTYINSEGAELTVQQWSARQGDSGLSLTITCATDDFPQFRQTAEEIVATTFWEE